jgi:hypothetical protein
MIVLYGIEYATPDEAARLLKTNVRTLNRWAVSPESASERARALAPITQLNGRRLYPAQNVLNMVKDVFGIEMTIDQAKELLASESEPGSSDQAPDSGELGDRLVFTGGTRLRRFSSVND